MFNILINNLSTVRLETKENKYILDMDEAKAMSDNDKSFTGVYTNEPITHALVRKFVMENEKLDVIYSLASEKVLKGKIFDNNINENNEGYLDFYAKYLNLEKNEILGLTHYGFYRELVCKAVSDERTKSQNDLNGQELLPDMKYEEITNNPDTKGIHTAVLNMAKTIIELYKKYPNQCRLYMDYTGGDRTTATVMIALTKMLEERDIKVDHIWAVVGFNSNEVNPVRERIEVNYIFDLISGLQEFNKYGKADILISFLEKSEEKNSIVMSDYAKKVQEKIQQLADQIQLCRSGSIRTGIGELVNSIIKYEKYDTVRDPMFDYLIYDIKNNYSQIYEPKNRTIPNIISWCLDKGWIQQAVTIYAELLPEYLVEHILSYDKKGWNDVIKSVGYNGKKIEIYKNEIHNYINYGRCNVTDIQASIVGTGKGLNESYKNYKCEYVYINYYIWKEIYRRNKNKKHNDTDKIKAEKISNYIINNKSHYTQVSVGISEENLKEILNNYMVFKKLIRHSLNHADGKFSPKEIRGNIIWTDQNKMEDEFDDLKDMSVHLLEEIMRDLLLQLDTVIPQN